MWTSLLLLTGLLNLAAAAKPALPVAYEVGRSYVYDYSASALTGMPKVSAQMSGFQIKGTLSLTALGEKEFSVVLAGKIVRIQRDMSPMDPRACGLEPPLEWDEKRTKELKGWATLAKKMNLPLLFKWKPSGFVGDVMPHPEDEQWSVDLKKGAIGMLSGSFQNMTAEQGGSFDVREDENVDGICRTAYTFSDPDENGVREASRIRDLSSCTETPTFRHSLFSSIPCEKGGKPGIINWVQGETATEYNITTGNKKFMIYDAQTCSQYGATSPGQKQYGMASFVEQYLNFKSDKESSDKAMTSETTDDNVQTLQLKMVRGAMMPKKKNQKKIVAKIQKMLEKISSAKNTVKMHDDVDKTVEMLRGLTREDVQKVWEATAKTPKMRKHLADILSSTGTQESLQFCLDLVRGKNLSDPDSAQLLRLSVIAASAAPRDMVALADEISARDRPLTFRAAWLAAGTAIGKDFTTGGGKGMSAQKVAKLAADMAKRPITVAKHDMSPEERDVLLLSTVGNTGMPEMMDLILTKLSAENSVTVRLAAIRAMRKIAPLPGSARTVRRALFGVLADPEEDIELRAGAYLVLVTARPTSFHLAVLAELLRKEPSEHLRSFVSSHLRILARLRRPSPCVAKMARFARRLLRALPSGGYLGPSRFRSRVFYMPLSKMLGIGVYGAVIYGKESTLPRTLTVGLRGVFEGNLVNFAEISVRSNETDKLLRGFFGPQGKMYDWLAGKLKIQDIMPKPGKKDSSKPTSDVGTSITYSLFGEDLFHYYSNAARKAQIMSGTLPSNVAAFLGMAMKSMSKGGFNPIASWDRLIYLDSNNAVATSVGIPATFDIVHSSHRKGYVHGSMPGRGVAQIKTHTGVSYRMRTMFGLELADKWTNVASTVDMALFPSRTDPMLWTMSVDSSMLKKGKLMQMVHLARPPMPLQLFKASVSLHLGSSESAKPEKLIPADREFMTEKMDGRMMNMFGIKFSGQVTRAVKLRRVMDGMEDFMSTKNILSTPMEMKIEMEDTKKAKKVGVMLSFKMGRRKTKKVHPMTKKFPKRKRASVETLRPVKVPSKLKMKPAKSAYLDMPAKASNIVKEGIWTLQMCNMEVQKDGSTKHKDMTMLGKLILRLQGKGFYEVLLALKPLMASYRLRGAMGSVGAPAIYDPKNPFSITKNAKHVHYFKLEDMRRKKTLISGTSLWSISPWWVKWWKKAMKNPDRLRINWPDIYQCVQDFGAKKKKEFYPDSVSCFRAWEMLNTFDKVKVESTSSRFMNFGMPSDDLPFITDMFERFFTDMDVTNDKQKKKRTMEAWLSPTDRRTMRLRTTLKSWMRRLSYEKCEVDYYADPNAVYARTFDGAFYTVPAAKAGTKGNHVVLAEDRRRGLFTVSLVANGAMQLRYKIGSSVCMVEIGMDKKGITTKSDGPKTCSHELLVEGNDRAESARVTVRALQVSVMSNGFSITEISVGPFYHDSLQGLCGDLDREPELGEFRGGTCANPKFFEDPHQLVAHFSRKGSPKLPQSCDM